MSFFGSKRLDASRSAKSTSLHIDPLDAAAAGLFDRNTWSSAPADRDAMHSRRANWYGSGPERTAGLGPLSVMWKTGLMMPLYFIDSSDGERDIHDEVGYDFRDHDAARAEALAAMGDMARDKIPQGDYRVLTVTVREKGMAIYAARLTMTASWIRET